MMDCLQPAWQLQCAMKNLLSLCILLLLAVSAQAEKTEIKIGVVAPLSGDTAVYGVDMGRIIPLVEARMNAGSATHSYKIIVEDGQCGAGKAATSAAQKLLHVDHVNVLVTGCSGETLQVAPIAEREKIPLISFIASHPDITHAGDYIFRIYPSMDGGVARLAEYLRTKKDLKLAVLTEQNAFTVGIEDQMLKQLPKQIVFHDQFTTEDADLRALLLRAQAAKPNAYYLNSVSPRSYQTLFTQVKGLGISEQIYTYHQPADHDVMKNLGAAQNGVIFLEIPDPPAGSAEFQEFHREFLKKYPQGATLELAMRTAYDSLTLLYHAIETVGTDTAKIRDFLYAYNADGAIGRVSFDKNGDVKDLHFVLKQIENGKVVSAK